MIEIALADAQAASFGLVVDRPQYFGACPPVLAHIDRLSLCFKERDHLFAIGSQDIRIGTNEARLDLRLGTRAELEALELGEGLWVVIVEQRLHATDGRLHLVEQGHRSTSG